MRKQNMSFQLGITFEDVEVKGIKIDLKNFLFFECQNMQRNRKFMPI